MRSAFILTLMAATAVTPVASAAAQDRGRDRPGVERQSRAERPARAERAQRAEPRAPRAPRAERAPIVQRQQQRAARVEARSTNRPARLAPNRAIPTQRRGATIERRDDRRDARIERRDDRRDARIERRDDVRDARIERNDDRRDSYNRSGSSRDRWAGNRSRSGSWSRNWRNDRRYDWQRYRNSNRNIYHVGRYYSPYRNHRYSRFSIGLFLGSGFYGQNYWINDPYYYRLPPAYPGTRWVRYYDDVMLVDVYSGEVIDVIYDFFW